jgi:hypothetical protein
MRYRQDNGADPFFFLIGLALVMFGSRSSFSFEARY